MNIKKNNSIKYMIEEIRAKNKISDYLSSKGILPVSQHEHRLAFRCPIHNDANPSFMVFLDDNTHENYFCFGCLKSGDIISLYAELEKISWKQSIRILGKDIIVTDSHRLDVTVEQLKNELKNISLDKSKNPFGEISAQIATMGFAFMKAVHWDEQERQLIEKLYKKIDSCILGWDIDGLNKIYDFLSGNNQEHRNAFECRIEGWQKKQKEIDNNKLLLRQQQLEENDNE